MSLLQNSNAISSGGYDINNSLRFRSSASAFLNRTPGTTGNQKTFTWSGWVKRGALGSQQMFHHAFYGDSGRYASIYFTSSDTLVVQSGIYTTGASTTTSYNYITTQVFRDPSAWYHIVLAVDTTQATSGNRVKVYVNGSQITAFGTSTAPSQNDNTFFNITTSPMYIGKYAEAPGSSFLDGYLAEVNWIDGQALTPSSFGETDAVTGSWLPKKYTGTFGTNGFYLPFTPNTVAGYSTYYGSFNGSSQYLSISSCSATNFGTGNYTVEAWVYQNSRADSQHIVGGSSTCFQCAIDANGKMYSGLAGTGNTSFSTETVPLGMWAHLAWVRTGTSLTFYINGKASGTVSDSFNYSLGSTTVNIATSNNNIGSYDLNGNMSNVRVVKGSAVYSANFTPPTSNLTAITNTSLLTLLGATITDGSTNNWTISNTGSVAMTSATVGTYSLIANDASSNGNNWTPNNINAVTAGTTYDAMIDSPTLTSETVSNYCVGNPLDVSVRGAFTNGNLTCTTNGGGAVNGGSARLNTFNFTQHPVKWYWESTVTNTGGGRAGFGMLTNANVAQNEAWSSTGGWYLRADGIQAGLTNPGTFTTNDVMMFAYDGNTGKVWIGKNGTWTNSGVPASGTGQNATLIVGTEYWLLFNENTGGAGTAVCEMNYGQRAFTYTPPSGFKRLNTYNLPDSTIKKGNTVMDATLYTGTGASLAITNAGAFKPDFVWVKGRSGATDHALYDSVRGTTIDLVSNSTAAETTQTTGLTAFGTGGFTVGALAKMNTSAATYVGWQWQAGQGSTSSNTNGSITSTVSVNATAGFSIVTYTGTGANATVGHGLGVAPKFIIIKRRNGVTDWICWHTSISQASNFAIDLNRTAATYNTYPMWNTTSPTSSLFSLGTDPGVNGSTNTYVAYCWAEIAGFSKFGSYTGNGSADGPFIFTGFRPKFLMFKRTDTTSGWYIHDSSRNTSNVVNLRLLPNTTDAEATVTTLDFLSNGFKLRTSDADRNASGGTYIYMAFAENPFKNANAR